MELLKSKKLLVAVIVAVIAMALSSVGLDIPKEVIQEAVEDQLDTNPPVTDSDLKAVAEVVSVIDGDTIIVMQNSREVTVRIIGIDTPEKEGSPKGAECYGDKATERARELLEGRNVALETDNTQDTYDVYNRLLAYVSVDGVDFGEEMIKAGFAEEFTYKVAYKKQSLYRSAERVAKDTGQGLWQTCE